LRELRELPALPVLQVHPVQQESPQGLVLAQVPELAFLQELPVSAPLPSYIRLPQTRMFPIRAEQKKEQMFFSSTFHLLSKIFNRRVPDPVHQWSHKYAFFLPCQDKFIRL